jgi:hypothetical protein
MAYARRVADGVKRIEQPADPLVGGVNIILGDIVPDAIQIPIGIIAPASWTERSQLSFFITKES